MSKANCCSVGFVRSKVWSYPQVSRPTAFPLPVCHTGQQVFLGGTGTIFKANNASLFQALRRPGYVTCVALHDTGKRSNALRSVRVDRIQQHLVFPIQSFSEGTQCGGEDFGCIGIRFDFAPSYLHGVFAHFGGAHNAYFHHTCVHLSCLLFSSTSSECPPPLLLAQLAAELQKLAENTVAPYEVLAQLT